MNRSALSRAMKSIGMASPTHEFVPFGGGLDVVTPPLFTKPGFVRESQNFEADYNGGYRRIAGYERHDGRPKPSDAQYATLSVTITGAFAAGDTITGVTSAATAVVVAVVTSSDPDYLVITKISGSFVSGETLNVSGSGQGTTSSTAVVNGASSQQLHAQYINIAADEYRDDILAVPGSGAILGTWRFNDTTYAFRNEVGGTAAAIYKSSTGGWVNVPLGEEISFTGGNSSVGEGDTLTQGGVTATIKRVVVVSGSSPNLVGRLIIHGRSGGNFAAGAATSDGGGSLTLSGAETAISILPDGVYEFITENFGGSTGTRRIYGCDAVNRGFEFDGTDYGYVPITTGMTADAPTNVYAHKNHLFFAFGPSAQHSGPGTPYVWSPVFGAAELAMGDDITGFMEQPGSETSGTLAIFTRNRTSMLYGNGSSDWELVPYRKELGAYSRSVQDIGFTVFFDDRGITNIQTAQVHGNFAHATMSDLVRTLVNAKRSLITASCVSRDRSQYRVFFSDRTALYITVLGRKLIGIMPMRFSDVVRNICSVEDSDGSEVMVFGSDEGFVYQLDKGTSLDGDDIEFFMDLAWNSSQNPRMRKRYRKCMFEISGDGYAEFGFSYVLGYGSTDISQPGSTSVTTGFSASNWDTASWEAFSWDGQTLLPSEVGMDGTAENVSLRIRGSSDYFVPFKFSGSVVHYTPRRALR